MTVTHSRDPLLMQLDCCRSRSYLASTLGNTYNEAKENVREFLNQLVN